MAEQSLFRFTPERTQGPLAPDALTDHEHVVRGRKDEADGAWRRFIEHHLLGEPRDMTVPITNISFLKIFDKMKIEDGKPRPRTFAERMKDSYQYGQELYRRIDRAFVWLLQNHNSVKSLDAFDVGRIDLGHSRYEQDEKIETINPERMDGTGSSIGRMRGKGYRIYPTPEDTFNRIEGPADRKRLRGPEVGDDGEGSSFLASRPVRRALPSPPRQITDERDVALKGRNAARKKKDDLNKGDGKEGGKNKSVKGKSRDNEVR